MPRISTIALCWYIILFLLYQIHFTALLTPDIIPGVKIVRFKLSQVLFSSGRRHLSRFFHFLVEWRWAHDHYERQISLFFLPNLVSFVKECQKTQEGIKHFFNNADQQETQGVRKHLINKIVLFKGHLLKEH